MPRQLVWFGLRWRVSSDKFNLVDIDVYKQKYLLRLLSRLTISILLLLMLLMLQAVQEDGVGVATGECCQVFVVFNNIFRHLCITNNSWATKYL